jgi:hypothetical protein
MRKESLKIARAFAAGVAASAARTRTDGQAVYLHDNLIAQRGTDGSIWVTLAGWGTVTTRESVNTLCQRARIRRAGFISATTCNACLSPMAPTFETCPRDHWMIAAAGGAIVNSAEA